MIPYTFNINQHRKTINQVSIVFKRKTTIFTKTQLGIQLHDTLIFYTSKNP